MINLDCFDALETAQQNKSRFSHVATFLLAASIPLGVEMGVQVAHQRDPVAIGILVVCVGALVLGLAAGFYAYLEGGKYKNARTSLFDQERLLADETIINFSDGSSDRIKHPIKSVSR